MNITKLTFNEYMEYSQIYVAWLAEIKDNKIVNGLHIYDSKVKVVEEIEKVYLAQLMKMILDYNRVKGDFYKKSSKEVFTQVYKDLEDALKKDKEDLFYESLKKDFGLQPDNYYEKEFVKVLATEVYRNAKKENSKTIDNKNEELQM